MKRKSLIYVLGIGIFCLLVQSHTFAQLLEIEPANLIDPVEMQPGSHAQIPLDRPLITFEWTMPDAEYGYGLWVGEPRDDDSFPSEYNSHYPTTSPVDVYIPLNGSDKVVNLLTSGAVGDFTQAKIERYVFKTLDARPHLISPLEGSTVNEEVICVEFEEPEIEGLEIEFGVWLGIKGEEYDYQSYPSEYISHAPTSSPACSTPIILDGSDLELTIISIIDGDLATKQVLKYTYHTNNGVPAQLKRVDPNRAF